MTRTLLRSLARTLPMGALFLGQACTPGADEPKPEPTPNPSGCTTEVCSLSGTITEDLTLTADKKWLLQGGVFIGDDTDPTAAPTTLTIEPGTTIYGDTSAISFLLITRGSRIIADGTADAPIVFTSAKEEGQRARGDWGGIVVNGQAPVNGCSGDPCTLLGEAGTGTYGGDKANDDSGVLRYVRVEFAGALIDDENELNGFGFQGVGSGTIIENVQAHLVSDDCIEFYGGTAQAKRVLCTGAGDDNLDWTFGWTGKVQFLVAQQYGDAGGHGIEADNNDANHGLTPMSRPTISNVTLVGVPGSENSKIGVLLRRGTGAELSNIVVQGFNDRCFDVDDAATFANLGNGDIALTDSIFDCETLTDDAEGDAVVLSDWLLAQDTGNATTEPGLFDATNVEAPGLCAASSSASASGARVPADAFFEQVAFRGGCGVGADADWTRGWTAFPAR